MPVRKRRLRTVAGLLVEAALIVFSVLLALSVAEWRDTYRERQTVRTALDLIAEELQGNRRILDRRVAYYDTMADTLAWMIERASPQTVPEAVPGWQGIRPPLFTTGSYEAAITTQAFSNMDLRTASALARIYAFQGLYVKLLDKALDQVIDREDETLAELRGMFREMAYVGRELSEAYGEGLEGLAAPAAE